MREDCRSLPDPAETVIPRVSNTDASEKDETEGSSSTGSLVTDCWDDGMSSQVPGRSSAQHLTISELEAGEQGVQHRHQWPDSPFAVGPTKSTWAEEDAGCWTLCRSIVSGSNDVNILCTAFVCSRLGAGRVGNMVVLWQRMDEVDGENGERMQRPRLVCVLGPFWAVCSFITMPVLLAFSIAVYFWRLAACPCLPIVLTWGILHVFLVFSIVMASCSDPGLMYRHAAPPPGEEGESWSWNSQANTYRPITARYDAECAVVIDGYSHTCPWIGTAVGKRNHVWFKAFLVFAGLIVIYNIALLLFHHIRKFVHPY